MCISLLIFQRMSTALGPNNYKLLNHLSMLERYKCVIFSTNWDFIWPTIPTWCNFCLDFCNFCLHFFFLAKNVAADIAEKLCESVATKLEGKVMGTFSGKSSLVLDSFFVQC